MKKIFKYISLIVVLTIGFSSCVKDTDLMTEDANEGGMVDPIANVPYKLNNTPVVNVNLDIPRGPGIAKVVVEKYFLAGDGSMSNSIVAKEVEVNGANESVADDGSSVYDASFTQTYAELIEGLTVGGQALPSDENNLAIGDKFVFSYTSVMMDGREVFNSASTNIAIANKYAGTYKSTVLYYHPSVGYDQINSTDIEDRDVSAISADVSEVGFAVWTDNKMRFGIDPVTNLITSFEVDDTWSYDVRLAGPTEPTINGKVSHYDPDTGIIYLYYAYDGGANAAGETTRVFHHTLEPK